MNDDAQLAAMDAWLASHPAPNLPRDMSPAAYEDEDVLIRSRLSRRAATAQRTGRYFPAIDDEGLDRDGWAVGAEYRRTA